MKKVSSEFVIESFVQKQKKKVNEKVPLIDTLNIGTYLITPILLGVFFGLFLDNKSGKKPFFVLGGLFLGVVASFYNLYKLIKQTNNARN